MSSGAEILNTLRERGFVQQINDEAGLTALLGRGPVTFYAGFDPTRRAFTSAAWCRSWPWPIWPAPAIDPIAVVGAGRP